MTDNPFATEAAWEVSDFLGPGDHVVSVTAVDGSGNSSGGHPQLELTVGNANGSIRDWIVIIPATVGKVIQLFEAAGLPRPEDSEVKKDGTGFRLAPAYVQQLLGTQVGVIVRDEPDRLDPTKTRTRVKGYVGTDRIGSDVTPADPWSQQADPMASSAVADGNDVPF